MNIIEKYKDVSFANGKFLSDKSYAYDSIYFIAKFIFEYSEDGLIDLVKYQTYLQDFVSKIFNITDEADIKNYINDTIHVFVYSKILKKQKRSIFEVIDIEALQFIVEKIENAYIFIYCLTYYTVKNSEALDLYKEFCSTTNSIKKMEILNKINELLYELYPSTRSGANSQWAMQNTKYIINNLNFINYQPEITRSLTINSWVIRDPKMISTNVKGTRTSGTKFNRYLSEFDFEYVDKMLKDIMVYEGVE